MDKEREREREREKERLGREHRDREILKGGGEILCALNVDSG